MQHPTSLRLYDYWNRRLAAAGAPAGGVIGFAGGAPLADLFLLALQPAAIVPIRFCGAAIAARYGEAPAPAGFLGLWSERDRARIARCLQAMPEDSVGLLARIAGETAGGGFTDFEMLLLPLHGASGCDRAVGALSRIGGHDDRQPIRARLVAQSLRAIRVLRPRRECSARAAPASGRRATPPGEDRRCRSHLTLIAGGR